jgi:hypothetical protein
MFLTTTIYLFSQDRNNDDLIIRKNGDKLRCKITNIDSTYVFFEMEKNGVLLNTHINKNDIQEIEKDEYINNSFKNKTGILLERKNIDNQGFLTSNKILIKEGKNVRIICKNNEVFEGKFYVKNDSVISIYNGNFSINDIAKIRRSKILLGGIGWTVIGGFVTSIGIVVEFELLYNVLNPFAFAFPIVAFGIIPTTIGIVTICRHRSFKSEKWDMRIISKQY